MDSLCFLEKGQQTRQLLTFLLYGLAWFDVSLSLLNRGFAYLFVI